MSYFHTSPIIKVKQPFGDFYITSIPAKKLVDVCYSFPAVYGEDTLTGIQRGINTERVNKIKDFCLTEKAMFPSSVILSVNYNKKGLLADKEQWYIEDDMLIIPSGSELASIVDGQHRIEGIRKAIQSGELTEDFDIICSLYFELPAPQQAEVFATINFNQQKVDKSLAYQLFGYELDSNNPEYWAPDTLAIYLSRLLDKESDSPFEGRISFGMAKVLDDEDESDEQGKLEWKVSTSTIVEGISSLISTNTTKDRYKLHKKRLIKKKRDVLLENKSSAPLREFYINYKDGQLYDLISSYFKHFQSNFWYEDGLSFMHKTIGIQASFDLLKQIAIDLNKKNIEVDFSSVIKYLNNIDMEELKKLNVNFSGVGRLQIKNQLIKIID